MRTRRVAIAIAASDAKPLPYLSAAINGARAFHAWALQLGYESTLVVDEEKKPVTIPRLRAEFDTILRPLQQPIHRLIIYFAGHGLIRGAEEGLWLLSDWNDELRAVAVEGLKRRLYRHDIRQIAIFSDSCRTVPPDFETLDLVPDALLGRGPEEKLTQPYIDKFVAAQDGAATFSIPGEVPEEDRCLFSGLLMEALWGAHPDAYSKVVEGKITSSSLRDFLKAEVPRRAALYKRELHPTISPDFPDGDNIYFPEGSPPPLPVFPAWPPPDSATAMGPAPNLKKKRRRLRTFSPPIDSVTENRMREAFRGKAGFVVEGAATRALWTTENIFAERVLEANWWEIRERAEVPLRHSAPALLEFEDGLFAAVTALPSFVARVVTDAKGVTAVIYWMASMPVLSTLAAEAALARMDAGALRVDEASDLAVGLREWKHADPVLGVLSAYLYDSIGDVDSIRRMAYFYVARRQPIPFDIALLGHLRAERRDGRLWANVPSVSERKPRTENEELKAWSYRATPEAAGEVGGFWPWMRQGWTFLEEDDFGLIHSGLLELAGHLSPARFTCFSTDGGVHLAKLFGLSRVSEYENRVL